MTDTKKDDGLFLPMTVTDGVTVDVLPYDDYDYLMTTKEVAKGYGTSIYAVRMSLIRNGSELIEGKHYVKGGNILLPPSSNQPNQIFWTKRGIVRLGFFIKSERSKLFRDWAEELIINVGDLLQAKPSPVYKNQLPPKRNHNRLTQERIIDILADVCRIDDRELRLSLTSKIMGGQQ